MPLPSNGPARAASQLDGRTDSMRWAAFSSRCSPGRRSSRPKTTRAGFRPAQQTPPRPPSSLRPEIANWRAWTRWCCDCSPRTATTALRASPSCSPCSTPSSLRPVHSRCRRYGCDCHHQPAAQAVFYPAAGHRPRPEPSRSGNLPALARPASGNDCTRPRGLHSWPEAETSLAASCAQAAAHQLSAGPGAPCQCSPGLPECPVPSTATPAPVSAPPSPAPAQNSDSGAYSSLGKTTRRPPEDSRSSGSYKTMNRTTGAFPANTLPPTTMSRWPSAPKASPVWSGWC